MKSGKYRNRLGAELVIMGPALRVGAHQTLGGIWYAETPPDIFGVTFYLVTEESLREAGYELVEEEQQS